MAGNYNRNSNYGGNNYYNRGGNNNSYGNSNNSSQSQRQPFDLNAWVEDMIDIYGLLKAKADEAGLEIPADALARWVTSAKISMDK